MEHNQAHESGASRMASLTVVQVEELSDGASCGVSESTGHLALRTLTYVVPDVLVALGALPDNMVACPVVGLLNPNSAANASS